jgi:hypothetical protein
LKENEMCRRLPYPVYGPMKTNVTRAACLIMVLCTVLCCREAFGATRFYSIVGAGGSYRDAYRETPPYHATIVSPWVEAGVQTRRGYFAGFTASFYLDPENTSDISSVILGGKMMFFIVPRVLYWGVRGGLHIERDYDQDEYNNETISLSDAELMANVSVHFGSMVQITETYILVFDAGVSQSFPGYYTYSGQLAVGIMRYF